MNEAVRRMNEAEKIDARNDILAEVGDILRRDLAADAWGRILVEVVRHTDGAPAVANIDVEEIFGDESQVDALFGGEGMRDIVPLLSKAIEALCALDEVALDDVEGGTFVHLGDGRFAFLPGLVHTPSAKLDESRETVVRSLRAKNDALAEKHGFPSQGELGVDLAREALTFVVRGHSTSLGGRATLIGTFVPASRTWGWGASNPHVPDAVRRPSAELLDAIADRDMWELSTPVFATDEPTAWALAALACARSEGDAVVCIPEDGGKVFLLVRELDHV